ncbi:hypothetical protein F2Q69_00005455 [Brassica cretica]|uniref:Uncharacterized protein n=1 Tax=Brassica cretica TaxID=69181 RepID=A0A8S9P6G1_BRACR|nr:hypothetical protein F2Q69_00005455 [Brassica cretica]
MCLSVRKYKVNKIRRDLSSASSREEGDGGEDVEDVKSLRRPSHSYVGLSDGDDDETDDSYVGHSDGTEEDGTEQDGNDQDHEMDGVVMLEVFKAPKTNVVV